ncbi:unnamed protein product [Periconia digitata]|uniref:Uncharacterized protein n=1 Tax=Periconia digitata TaxID=1303443 RepID=A0A9W4UDK2_9PLEO|nr:unnamed protein product [Periconia digitata]
MRHKKPLRTPEIFNPNVLVPCSHSWAHGIFVACLCSTRAWCKSTTKPVFSFSANSSSAVITVLSPAPNQNATPHFLDFSPDPILDRYVRRFPINREERAVEKVKSSPILLSYCYSCAAIYACVFPNACTYR